MSLHVREGEDRSQWVSISHSLPTLTGEHSPNHIKRVATLTRGALKSSGQSSVKMSPVTIKKQPSSETPKPPPGEEVN